MAPNEVTLKNEGLVRSRLYPEKSYNKIKNRNGISKSATPYAYTPFEKGYVNKWSRELFEIESRIPTVPETYGLKDMLGETIKGKFYVQELQKVDTPREGQFMIERILKTKRAPDGKIWHLVNWLGYPDKFNTCLLYTSPSPRDS